MQPEDLVRVSQFCEANPAFKVSAIRWLIHNSHDNGLADAKVIVRIGRSVYIDKIRFAEWLEGQAA